MPGPTGGTWAILLEIDGGQWLTSPLAWSATAAEVQSALEALAPIGSGGVTVEIAGNWPEDYAGYLAITFAESLGELAEVGVNHHLIGWPDVVLTPSVTQHYQAYIEPVTSLDEQATISVPESARQGTYTIGKTGDDGPGYELAWDVSAETVQEAVRYLYLGEGSVTGGPGGYLPFVVTWTAQNVPDLYLKANNTPGQVTVEVNQQGRAEVVGQIGLPQIQYIMMTYGGLSAIRIEAAGAFTAGALSAGVYLPGAAQAGAFVPGALVAQVCPE